MSLSISSTGNSPHRQRFLEQVQALQERNRERLASGKRIVGARDDSAGLAIAKRLEAAVRGTAQGERNVRDSQSLVRTADAALETSQEAISRMRELTIQARNGTLSDDDRATIQQEFDQLAQQLDQTAAGTSFGDRKLLDGSLQGVEVETGQSGNDLERTTIDIQDSGTGALGVKDLDVGDPNTIAALDQAQEQLGSTRARLGALDNTLGRQQEQLASARENSEAARSRIEDADYAREVANSTRNRILTDLTLSGQRIADRSRARVLDLLS